MKLNFLDPPSSQVVILRETSQGLLSVGRGSSCNVVIPAQYSSVSSLHATIRPLGDAAEIIDGDGSRPSTNGLFIDGFRQAPGVWHRIKPGMAISLGKPAQVTSINLLVAASNVVPEKTSSSYTTGVTQQPLVSVGIPNKYSGTYAQALPDSISSSMKLRLANINKHLTLGYTLRKDLGAFPVFVGGDGRKHNISILSSPAGFSWIAFFFPFAVCTQIREWSYFYFCAILFAVCAIISVLFGFDPGNFASISISLMYGIYFPYLRHIALSRGVKEIAVGWSIVFGILLAILASAPGFLIQIGGYYIAK